MKLKKSDNQTNHDKYIVAANITKYQMRGVNAVVFKKFCKSVPIFSFVNRVIGMNNEEL